MSTHLISLELDHAREAHAAGNAGQARVCARRAAGWAIRPRSGFSGDAIKQLKWLQGDVTAPEAVRAAALRLTTKVDTDHHLPFDNDPVEDAQLIIAFTA